MKTYLKQACIGFLFATFCASALADNNQRHQKPRPKFSMLDLNTDGDIDFSEFASHQLPFGDHKTVFNHIDRDQNGVISKQEFADHKPPRHPRRNKNVTANEHGDAAHD